MVSMGITIQVWHHYRREGRDTYSIPISPLLSSELPLPQMDLPVNSPVNNLKHKGTTNSAQYRHSTQSRGDNPIGRQSRAQRGLHLWVKW
jgi:hypothetical protein